MAIDWVALERAFEAFEPDRRAYLDPSRGEVVWLDAVAVAPDGLIAIEPLDASVELAWMRSFSATLLDRSLRERLLLALDGLGPLRHFRLTLEAEPELLERWRQERVRRRRQAIERWFAATGVEAEAPPWATSPLGPAAGGESQA